MNKEVVDHPKHYQSKNGIEVIDVIDAFTNVIDFDIGNVIKYVCRWREKGGINDLKKAKWYLEHAIDKLESKEV